MPSFFDSCVCDVIRRLGSVDSMIRRALVILHIVMVGGVDVRTGADRGSRRSVMICCGNLATLLSAPWCDLPCRLQFGAVRMHAMCFSHM